MIKIVSFFFFTAIPLICISQQIKLTGQVSIHNSQHDTGKINYVQNAQISADFSKSAITDNEGKFSLEFVEISDGLAVKVKAEKSGFDVVNDRDLSEVVLSKNRKTPLKIYFAENGKIAEAKLELLNISKKALFAERDAEIRRLQGNEKEIKAAIAQLESRLNVKIDNPIEAINLLNNYVDELYKRLPEYAHELATINLDFSSNLYKEAYAHFKNGNFEKVIVTLAEEKLAKNLEDSKINIVKGRELIETGARTKEKGILGTEQTINGYALKAKTLSFEFKYLEAAIQYDIIIEIYKDPIIELEKSKLSKWYEKAATNYFFAGKYQKALKYQLEEIDAIKSFNSSNDSLLAASYTNIAVTYRELGDYNTALNYQKKAIQLFEIEFGQDHLNLAIPYYAIAGTFSYLGNLEETHNYYEKALAIFLKHPNADRDNLAVLYGNMAVHFISIGEYEKALESRKKGLEILEQIYKLHDPLLILAYSSLGATYNYVGNYEKALEYELKSTANLEKIYHPEHPELLTAYNNLGTTYSNMGIYEKALEYQIKATKGREKILPPQHPSLFTSYRNVAKTYFEIKDYDAAIKYYLKALRITNKPYTYSNDEMLYEMYSHLSEMYQLKEDYSNALIYNLKIIPYMEKNFSAMDLNLAAWYDDTANLYIFLRKYSEAIYFKEKVIKIFKFQLDRNDSNLKSAIEILDMLKEKIKLQKK